MLTDWSKPKVGLLADKQLVVDGKAQGGKRAVPYRGGGRRQAKIKLVGEWA